MDKHNNKIIAIATATGSIFLAFMIFTALVIIKLNNGKGEEHTKTEYVYVNVEQTTASSKMVKRSSFPTESRNIKKYVPSADKTFPIV